MACAAGHTATTATLPPEPPASFIPATASTTGGRSAVLVAGISFVPADTALHAECQATADAIGYSVPCPRIVPDGLTATKVDAAIGCPISVIAAPCAGADAQAAGWVWGSSDTPGGQHLVIQASPSPVTDAARFVTGPPLVRGTVTIGPAVTVAGINARWVSVSPDTDTGSMRGHEVLVWSQAGHTFGIGFHNLDGLEITRELDLELVRSVEMVAPHP